MYNVVANVSNKIFLYLLWTLKYKFYLSIKQINTYLQIGDYVILLPHAIIIYYYDIYYTMLMYCFVFNHARYLTGTKLQWPKIWLI